LFGAFEVPVDTICTRAVAFHPRGSRLDHRAAVLPAGRSDQVAIPAVPGQLMLALCCLHSNSYLNSYLNHRALQSERGHLPESLTLLACTSPGHRRMTEGLARASRCMSFLTFVLWDVSQLSSSASIWQVFWPSVSSTHVLESSIRRRARRMSSHGRRNGMHVGQTGRSTTAQAC
jgi:hypothetical protein